MALVGRVRPRKVILPWEDRLDDSIVNRAIHDEALEYISNDKTLDYIC